MQYVSPGPAAETAARAGEGLLGARDRREVPDGTGCCYFGHDPSSAAEHVGDTVRLTPGGCDNGWHGPARRLHLGSEE
ncbi:hypothetical protein J8N05_36325 [Streptomyces sp. BH-SS-21]|uniref:Uncharacterized protein n=1 Tax=Streptomyces liliiviolaceus TaxID=2823109 RepID=A0A941BHB3_9ACTN|nr:hypothetical protein [Streptomyces liliiviolaceus]MBQ0853634.1 hypothetical protein [Streptomyces liliiviolaceus]